MENPEHKHIEQYITHREELTEEECVRIEHWIATDPEINRIFEWLKQFYSEFGIVQNSKEIKGDRPAVISLKSTGASSQKPKIVILAAQTPVIKREKSNLRLIRTLISEKDKTLIRILENRNSDTVDLHVLSEFLNDNEILLIDLPGMNSLLISETGGRFRLLKKTFEHLQTDHWNHCRLFFPVARADLFYDRSVDHIHMDTHGTDKMKLQVQAGLSDTDSRPCIEISCSGRETVTKAVIKTDRSSYFFPVHQGKFRFDKTLFLKNGLSVFFYN